MPSRYINILITAFALCGCMAHKSAPSASEGAAFFAGHIKVGEVGTSVVFNDCANPVTMDFSKNRNLQNLISKVQEANEDSSIYFISFYGILEDNGFRDTIPGVIKPEVRIDSLMEFRASTRCLYEYTLPGIYRSSDEQTNSILRLKPDFTFSRTLFHDDGSETEELGEWFRISKLELAVRPWASDIEIYQIIPDEERLVPNSGKDMTEYIKVYL